MSRWIAYVALANVLSHSFYETKLALHVYLILNLVPRVQEGEKEQRKTYELSGQQLTLGRLSCYQY